MAKLEDLEESKIKHILVYGPPKSGKTALVGGIAKEKKLIYIGGESGHDVFFNVQVLPVEYRKNITVINIPDTRHSPMYIESCLKIIRGTKMFVCDEHGKVNCPICTKDNKPGETLELNALGTDTVVCFDSLTQLTASASALISKGKPDDYKFQFDDWAKLNQMLDIFLTYVQSAKYHVVCISHETLTETLDGKDKIVPSASTRNFSRNSGRYFTDIVYCEVKNKKHVFASSTTYMNNIQTGSRSGVSMESIENPSLLEVFK